MSVLVGLDVGTSAVKALAVDAERGAILASASHDLDLSTPRPGWAEQSPLDWQEAAWHALRGVGQRLGARAADVRGIGLSGQMHSAVLLDEHRAVVRPAILWCDTRTTEECAEIQRAMGDDGLARTVGNRALEGFTLPKLLWLRRHEPAALARARCVVMPKDYVGMALTGVLETDASDASGTLAFEPKTRTWSAELLGAVGLSPELFPRARESSDVLGELTTEAAARTGLPAGTIVVHGAADNAAAAVGLGIVRPGRTMASIGTSGVVLAQSDGFVVEPAMKLHSFCHAVPGQHYLMGVMLAAGGSLRWYRDVLCDGEKLAADVRGVDPYEILTEAASTARAGAGGVVFLPYLMGERTPHNDAMARGALVGVTARTTKADVSRAVLEGITFGLADSLDLIRSLGARPATGGDPIRLTGGGAKSPFWRKLMADVFASEVSVTTSTEGPAFGAALLAGAGAGVFASVEEAADALVHITARVAPDAATSDRYRDIRAAYRGLYDDLKLRFRALAALE